MTRDRAAYMREYRARKKAAHEDYDAAKPTIGRIKSECAERIRQLEEEVRHLKAELANRPMGLVIGPGRRPPVVLDEDYSKRPIRPVPKRSGR